MMRRSIQLIFIAFLLFLVPCSVFGQVDSTLIRVRATGVDSSNTGIPVYYSPAHTGRANILSELLASVDEYFASSLGFTVDFHLAVLSEDGWQQVWPFPYGIPYVSLGAPWTIVMPASVEQSVLYYSLVDAVGEEDAGTMIDNIGFHEVGHVYISEFVYPSGYAEAPPVRWFDEFLAQYLAHAFLTNVALERMVVWEEFTTSTLAEARPKYTNLDDFEKEYYGYLGGPDGAPNYSWYQSVFAKQASDVYRKKGLGFLKELKEGLSWEKFSSWTSASLLKELELISPGFKAWAVSLEQEN